MTKKRWVPPVQARPGMIRGSDLKRGELPAPHEVGALFDAMNALVTK